METRELITKESENSELQNPLFSSDFMERALATLTNLQTPKAGTGRKKCHPL